MCVTDISVLWETESEMRVYETNWRMGCGLQPWMGEKSSESKQRILKYLIWYYRWFVVYSILTV